MLRNTLDFIRRWLRLVPLHTDTSERERAALARLAAGRRRLAEIGVLQGVGTRILREHMAPGGVLFAIDPFFRNRLGVSFHRWLARRHAGGAARGELRWLEMLSADAARDPALRAAPLDFLFIDGDHSWEGIRADWENFTPLLAPGALACLHDSRERPGSDSERYTAEVVRRDPRFELLEEVDSLTVMRRVAAVNREW